MRTLLLLLLVLATTLFSLGLSNIGEAYAGDDHGHDAQKASTHAESEHEHHEAEGQELNVSSTQMEEFGIVLRKAEGGEFVEFVETPGAVVVNEEKLSHISARFPGIVTKVSMRIGDTVNKGDSLATIESSESLRPYSITSMVNGTVIAKHATLGELLKEDDVAYTVADLSSVWVTLSIYQADIPLVKVGQEVEISQGHSSNTARGRISYISPVIDEDTRTASARVVLSNPENSWMPGLFVTGRITVNKKQAALLVPTSALHTIDEKKVVFVRSEHGIEAVEVSVSEQNDFQAILSDGLQLGQEYVAEGGFTLKAELSKSSFGHGHSH